MSPALQMAIQLGAYVIVGFLFGLGFHLAKRLVDKIK